MIVIDQKTKWIDVKLMEKGTNAAEIITKLKEMFAIFGLPVEIVSDNGPPFSSAEFVAFCQANGIKPVKSPPYHPQSNGAAERGVQTVKKGLEKSLFLDRVDCSKSNILNKLQNFLFTYRNTPSTVTGLSPAESIFKIKPRTRFNLLKPSCHNGIQESIKNKLFKVNDHVFVKNKITKLWQKGIIMKVISYCTYLVKVESYIKFVHASDLRENVSVPLVSDLSDSVQNIGVQDQKNEPINVECSSNFTNGTSSNSAMNTDFPESTFVREAAINLDENNPSQGACVNENQLQTERLISTSPCSTTIPKSRYGRTIKAPSRLNL